MTRPTVVTVIAVIGLVFGLLGICCGGFGLLGNALTESMMGASSQGDSDISRQLLASPQASRYNLFSSAVSLGLGFLLLIGSIGLFSMAAWSRGLMLFYSIFAILANIGSTLLYFMLLYPEQQKIIGNNPDAAAYLIGSYVGLGCGVVLGLVYPVAVLIILNKPEIKRAFENKF